MAAATERRRGDPESAPPLDAETGAEGGGGPPHGAAYAARQFLAFSKAMVDPQTEITDKAVDFVVRKSMALHEAFGSAAQAARSGLSEALAASSDLLRDTRVALEEMKTQYRVYEDMAFGKIKEGVIVAASHPSLSCGIAVGAGLVLPRRPRQAIMRNVRRLFVSKESLLSDAEAKVNGLRQSINLVKNESIKLEERALKAEAEMEQGRMALINEGRKIQKELRYINRVEKEALGLKALISELPGREVSRYRSEVSKLISQVKENKDDLGNAVARIINHGIRI